MMALVIQIFFPLAITFFLLHVRQKYNIKHYAAASALFLSVGIFAWIHDNNVFYYYRGPLNAAGFQSWAAPIAIATIAVVCAFRINSIYVRLGQIGVSFIGANFWLLYAGWIA